MPPPSLATLHSLDRPLIRQRIAVRPKLVPPAESMRRIEIYLFFFFSSRRRHTRLQGDWSSDVCSSDLLLGSNVHLLREDGLLSSNSSGIAVLPTVKDNFTFPFSRLIAGGTDLYSLRVDEIGRASCRERV